MPSTEPQQSTPPTSNDILFKPNDYYKQKGHLLRDVNRAQYDKFINMVFEKDIDYSVEAKDLKSETKISLFFNMMIEELIIDPALVGNKLTNIEVNTLQATMKQLIESALYTHFSNILKVFSKDDIIYSFASSVPLKDYAQYVCRDLSNMKYWHFTSKICELNPDSPLAPDENMHILDNQYKKLFAETGLSLYEFLENLELYLDPKDLETLRTT